MSLLKTIFGTKPTGDYSSLNTDMHSHFLPDLDDGCKTFEESLLLLKGMHEAGFRRIVCTPHIQAEHYRNSFETIAPKYEELKQRAATECPGIELHMAAEYLLDDGFGDLMQHDLLCFGTQKYVLVELSYFSPHPNYKNYLQDLLRKGYKPIMAHPERYGFWNKHDEPIQELHGAGILLQVNLPSLTGYYGSDIRRRGFDLLDKGLISLAGSDVHNMNYLKSVIEGLKQKALQTMLLDGSLRNAGLL